MKEKKKKNRESVFLLKIHNRCVFVCVPRTNPESHYRENVGCPVVAVLRARRDGENERTTHSKRAMNATDCVPILVSVLQLIINDKKKINKKPDPCSYAGFGGFLFVMIFKRDTRTKTVTVNKRAPRLKLTKFEHGPRTITVNVLACKFDKSRRNHFKVLQTSNFNSAILVLPNDDLPCRA